MADSKKTENSFNFLGIFSGFALLYFIIKFIVFPIANHKEKLAIPDLTFPDITLLAIVLLFQPQTAKIFESLDFSPQGGLKAEFKKMEEKVDNNQQAIDNLQQQQIELQREQIERVEKIIRCIYPLILLPGEIKILENLKKHGEENTFFEFYVTHDAAGNLRRLRDSKLIKLKPPYRYVSDLEKASNYAKTDKDFIDLAQYCEITKEGEEFLDKLKEILGQSQPSTAQ